jgi:hypothetical protein
MPTEFSYEHVFRAPSTTTILAAYFDPDHLATQDKLADLVDRTVTEDHDDGSVRRTKWLSYFEAMTWRRKDDACDLTVTPDILNGRVQISALYQLEKIGENQIHRQYSGKVTVNITLLSGKIERGIVAEFEKSMAMMSDCTQRWLDAHPAT